MKPVIVLFDKEKPIEPSELTRAVEEAYNQGFEDGYTDAEKNYTRILSHYIPFANSGSGDVRVTYPEAFNKARPIIERGE